MAVTPTHTSNPGTAAASGGEFGGRHWAIGTNVFLSIALAVTIVVFLQWGAFSRSFKADLTSSGINSLTPGTERLLNSLEKKVRLTVMYFQTDLENEDQEKYRRRMNDLAALYQGANRSMVEVESFNPLQDHAKRDAFLDRLRSLERFQKESEKHRSVIESFQSDYAKRIADLIQGELDAIASLLGGDVTDMERADLGQIQSLMQQWQEAISLLLRDVKEFVGVAQPRYGTAVSEIARDYAGLKKVLEEVISYAKRLQSQRPNISADVVAFLSGASDRYGSLIDDLGTEAQRARDVPQLELENILRKIGPTTNAVVVQTEDDAVVIDFSEVWPPLDPNLPSSSARFEQRQFKGEEKITSAILKLTADEQTAVIFVRYGGQPLFTQGLGGPQQTSYAGIKELIEDANYVVKEWDLATAATPPEFEDPPPAKKIFVVLRPTPPPPNFQRQQVQQAPFSDTHMQSLREAMGDAPRAIFIVGWMPGAFGAFPSPYEMNDYLKDEWGINIDADTLILNAMMGQRPGEYSLAQQSLMITDVTRVDDILMSDMLGQPVTFPYAAPIDLPAKAPDGVKIQPLLSCEKTESLWGVKDVQAYIQRARNDEPIVKLPDDPYGPFTIAASAEKGDAKIVVISSRDCMTDGVAMAPQLVLTSQGLSMRSRNPGNTQFFLNTLHWLNDTTEWMGIGQPVVAGTLAIDKGPGLSFVRVLVGGIWPLLAIVCALTAWWVRRR